MKETVWIQTPIPVPAASDDANTRTFVLGNVSCPPAQTARGRVSLGMEVDGHDAGFSFSVLNGAYAGPTVVFQGGVHGDEYDAMAAIRLLEDEVSTAELHGTVVCIPCVNEEAFNAGTRVNAIDGANFNRIFPGSPEGTFSLQLADLYVREVVPVADAMVDLHTGGAYGQIEPLAIVQRGYEELATGLGLAANSKVIWQGGKWGGTSRHAFLDAGKPAVTLEAGGGTYSSGVVAYHLNALRNVLRHLGMVAGEAKFQDHYLKVDATFAPAEAGGFFAAKVEPGDMVKKGDELAAIVGHLGEERAKVTAPDDGIVVWIRRRCATHIGDESIIFGRVEERITVQKKPASQPDYARA